MKNRGNWAYNGKKIIERNQVVVSIDDIGFQRGYTIYEFLRTYNNKPFLLNEHILRLQNSLSELGIEIKEKPEEIKEIIRNLIEKNAFTESSISTYVTPGAVDNLDVTSGNGNLFILVDEYMPFPNEVYEKGVQIISLPHKREIPSVKTTSYLTAIKNQSKLSESGAFEILYTDKGNVLECSTSNVFCFIGNKLVTTKEDILHGITRNYILEIAKETYETEERTVTMDELLSADEVFISASKKEIIPVIQVDQHKIGKGIPGEETKRLLSMFRESIK